MKIIADENIEKPVVKRLRQEGYEVDYIAESAQGASDENIVKLCARQKAILLTADKDFAELYFRRGELANGVILVRLFGLSSDLKASLVAEAFRKHAREFAGHLAVVTAGQIKIRKV